MRIRFFWNTPKRNLFSFLLLLSLIKSEMIKCGRQGCGSQFDPTQNGSDQCSFHSGGPIFHEGRKGWSCCDARVYDFDEFMKIPGCCKGPHAENVEKVAEIVEPQKAGNEPVFYDALSEPTTTTATVKTTTTTTAALNPFDFSSVANSDTLKSASNSVDESLLNDPVDAVIPADSVCKRQGCRVKYDSSSSSDRSPCLYHPGGPIFHEGSKGYSCCPRKVLEFEEFLKIPGCKSLASHRFLDASYSSSSLSSSSSAAAPAAPSNNNFRWDWYQTIDSIIVSIYVKNIPQENLSVSFYSNAFVIKTLADDSSSTIDNNSKAGVLNWTSAELFSTIDSSASCFTVFKTKVELDLKKTSGISWPALEKTDNVVTWTTFGTQDGKTTGTIGGKEYHVAKDIPIEMLVKKP